MSLSSDAIEAYLNVAYTLFMTFNKIKRINHTKRVRVAKRKLA